MKKNALQFSTKNHLNNGIGRIVLNVKDDIEYYG